MTLTACACAGMRMQVYVKVCFRVSGMLWIYWGTERAQRSDRQQHNKMPWFAWAWWWWWSAHAQYSHIGRWRAIFSYLQARASRVLASNRRKGCFFRLVVASSASKVAFGERAFSGRLPKLFSVSHMLRRRVQSGLYWTHVSWVHAHRMFLHKSTGVRSTSHNLKTVPSLLSAQTTTQKDWLCL